MSKPPYLGLDIGLRRTGVALSESGLVPQPLTTLEWQPPHRHELLKLIGELVRKHAIATVVVGIPLSEEGESTEQAVKTEDIVTEIQASLPPEIEIIRANEFYSTQDARALYPNVDKDAAAATLILRDYLEQHGSAW